MLKSMTGFARIEINGEWGQAQWEVKAVNHRYLDMYFRLPEGFRQLEPNLRKQLGSVLARGKVECQLHFQPSQHGKQTIQVNQALVTALRQASQELMQLVEKPEPLSLSYLMRWPEVITVSNDNQDALVPIARSFEEVLNALQDNRLQEGRALSVILEDKLEHLARLVVQAKEQFNNARDRYVDKLKVKLEQQRIELDQGRFEQEVIFFLNKMDVVEELDRLATHITEIKTVLASSKSVGRRLDFFMQELNREANTLASKSIDAKVSQCVVEMKVTIEQMREQIQNIE